MSGTYAEADGAANIEGGNVESYMGGTAVKGVSKANQAEMKRRVLQTKPTKSNTIADAQFRQLIEAMGPGTLHTPYLGAQLDDLRNNNQPNGYHSATLFWTLIAGAGALPYASDAAMDLLAANSNTTHQPVVPHLKLDEVA